MSYIEIRNLKKRFGDNVILDGVDLDIEKGEVVAIIGPSGTGKSTLLRCLNLLETPESGTFKVDGREYDLTTKKGAQKRQIRRESSMVFQQFNLIKHKNTLQNVEEGLRVVKKLSREEARARALEELEKVDMSDRLYHYPKHLSGGQQQRVAIARSLAMDPNLLLMDEPTSALDPELVGEVLLSIRRAAKAGNTTLLVTHEMNFVKSVANKIIFLENGKIVASGAPKDIFGFPENDRLKEFLSKINMLEGAEYTI